VLRLDGVRKLFRGEPVLDGIDLHVRRGETWGLIGPAASGKSVLLKVLCGLYRPDAGDVHFDGEDLAGASEERLMALRARVGIARALIARPELVIYDEPTAGLDPVTTSKIYDLLRKEQGETGATVVIVSSDVEALLRFVPRVGMIYRGKLRYDGPAAGAADADDPLVRQFVRGEIEGPL